MLRACHVLATCIGLFLSTAIFSMFCLIVALNFSHVGARFVSGLFINLILFIDLFVRYRFVVGRHYLEGRRWDKKVRLYGGFASLYLILPLVWTFSDLILDYYGYPKENVNMVFAVDETLIYFTMAYNILCSVT